MFITFEGPEGSGKTTQIDLLYRALCAKGYQVLKTREPGGTAIGDEIRAVLHDVRNTAMLPPTEVLLYSASRAQIVGQLIRPALAQGKIVLCDRYADSTIAYQGYGHGLDLVMLRTITKFATQGLRPDLTFYLDLPVEDGLQRKQQAFAAGESELNRMDRKEMDFHQRVREGYLELAADEPDRWIILDASQAIDDVYAQIRENIEALFKRCGFAEPTGKRRNST
jgi:dTMP kinase